MTKASTIFCSVLALLLSIIIFYSCWDNYVDLGSLKLKGELLLFGFHRSVFKFPDTNPVHFNWKDAEKTDLLCLGHNGKIIFEQHSDLLPLNIDRIRSTKIFSHLYYFDTEHLSRERVMENFKYSYSCQTLDYNADSKQYLFSGRINKKRGIYLMDTLYNVTRDILPELDFGDHSVGVLPSYFIDTTKIFINGKKTLFIADLLDNSVKVVMPGTIRCISPNREFIIVSGATDELYIYNVNTGDTTTIDNDAECYDATFSPDNKYIAFLKVEADLTSNYHRLCFFDIEKRKSYFTNIESTRDASLMWLE